MATTQPQPAPPPAQPTPASPQPVPPSPPKNLNFSINRKVAVIIGVVALLLILIGIAGWLYFNKAKQTEQAVNQATQPSFVTVSGTIDFNGVAPSGSTITVVGRKLGDSQFNPIALNVPAQDLATWSWNQATSGTEYELKALLTQNGQTLKESEGVIAAAPSQNISIRISFKNTSTGTTQSTISGSFNLNGYIPSGSTITVAQRVTGTNSFTNIVTNLPAADNSAWTWTGATAGQEYDLVAYLVVNGATAATSQTLTVSAPAANEVLTLNSPLQAPATASPTPQGGSISGSVTVNGVLPPSPSIVILSRVTGTVPFNTVISGLSANNGTTYSWPGAQAGVTYDLQAVLYSGSNVYAISNTITTPGPASNENFTINSSYTQPQPPTSVSVSCNGQSNGLWAVNITFNYVQNAQSYWVRLGDSQVNNRYMDQQVLPNSGQNSQTVTSGYVLGSGGTYYAMYAYSYQNTNNLSNYSAWSNQTQVVCNPPSPSPTPTPTPTTTASPAPSAT